MCDRPEMATARMCDPIPNRCDAKSVSVTTGLHYMVKPTYRDTGVVTGLFLRMKGVSPLVRTN